MSGEDIVAAAASHPADRVGHLLIRATNGDTLDPFFIKGHPNWPPRGGEILLSCFYYAILMTPKVTLLFDNDGRGGMCHLVPDEISGVWRTPELLSVLEADFDGLVDGSATFEATKLPPPTWRPNDWTPAESTPVTPTPTP